MNAFLLVGFITASATCAHYYREVQRYRKYAWNMDVRLKQSDIMMRYRKDMPYTMGLIERAALLRHYEDLRLPDTFLPGKRLLEETTDELLDRDTFERKWSDEYLVLRPYEVM
jgi:hypothetical protein